MNELTNEELSELCDTISDVVYYGDDEIVYGDGPKAVALRSALNKLSGEAKRRRLWWGS